jgi:hypothetical protein
MTFSGAPSAFLATSNADLNSIKNAIGWSVIPQALKDLETVGLRIYERLEAHITDVLNSITQIGTDLTEIKYFIGFSKGPLGWRNGTTPGLNNLYERLTDLEMRVGWLEPS